MSSALQLILWRALQPYTRPLSAPCSGHRKQARSVSPSQNTGDAHVAGSPSAATSTWRSAHGNWEPRNVSR